LEDFGIHLVVAHTTNIFDLDLGHRHNSTIRATKRVLIGSLAAARSSASRAVWLVTPSISNRMRPGLTRQTHNSGVPLPEPMRTSAGFFDTGRSGKIRIQKPPGRLHAPAHGA